MIEISQGAEAKIFRNNNEVIKERFSKKYRLPQLDLSLRKFRTRREAKILQKLEELNFPAPHLKDFSDKRMSIVMDFVPGQKLKDLLKEGDEFQQLAKEVGEKVGRLHQANIIHNDLTTSNMIKKENSELQIIDFGLSFFSEKVEDKAVDLFLLERSLESTHFDLYPEVFDLVIKSYKENYPQASEILERLEKVRSRGRNKKS